MSQLPRLTYFSGRGYAELIRMTLCAAGIEFTDRFIESGDGLPQLRKEGKVLFGQVPLLEIDGLNLVQRKAILRYLARRENLYGKNQKENALVDMYFEGSRDFMNGFDYLVFEEVEPILDEYRKKFFPRYLPVFEKILKDNGSGYLVGEGMTLADLALLEPLLTTHEYFTEDILKDYPFLQKFYKMMTEKDTISGFLKGPHRRPRNTPEHAVEVTEWLGYVVKR